MEEMLIKIVSILVVLGIIFVIFMSLNFYVIVGGFVYGLVSVVEFFSFFGLFGVDWFYYILVGGNFFLMYGFIK